MSEPFIAEVRIFAGDFAPRGWALCNGQTLPITQNTALYSLIGTTYGGNGSSTMGLPNLQGRAPMHPGQGPGLTARKLGESGGTESVTVTEAELPAHTHAASVTAQRGTQDDPGPDVYLAAGTTAATFLYGPPSLALDGAMESSALPPFGASQPHNNMQPYLTMNFIIALVGLYPSRG